MPATKMTICRSKTHDAGMRWDCDRPQGHSGPHQVHYPRSRVVLKTWPRKP